MMSIRMLYDQSPKNYHHQPLLHHHQPLNHFQNHKKVTAMAPRDSDSDRTPCMYQLCCVAHPPFNSEHLPVFRALPPPKTKTKHLSTDADSSTDTTVGWTENSQKPNFFEKRKKSSKTQKLKKVQSYANISDMPFNQRSLIHRKKWFLPCFVRQNQQKNNFFLHGDFRPLPNQNV